MLFADTKLVIYEIVFGVPAAIVLIYCVIMFFGHLPRRPRPPRP